MKYNHAKGKIWWYIYLESSIRFFLILCLHIPPSQYLWHRVFQHLFKPVTAPHCFKMCLGMIGQWGLFCFGRVQFPMAIKWPFFCLLLHIFLVPEVSSSSSTQHNALPWWPFQYNWWWCQAFYEILSQLDKSCLMYPIKQARSLVYKGKALSKDVIFTSWRFVGLCLSLLQLYMWMYAVE